MLLNENVKLEKLSIGNSLVTEVVVVKNVIYYSTPTLL